MKKQGIYIVNKKKMSLFVKKQSYHAQILSDSSSSFFKCLQYHFSQTKIDFPNNLKEYNQKLNKVKNPLSQRYLHLYEEMFHKPYKIQKFEFVDVALLASHFNIKLVFFVIDSQKKHHNLCHIKIITSYTIENFLPAFTYANQLSEREQFSLLALGPCAKTYCFLSNEIQAKHIFKHSFWPIKIEDKKLI